MGLDDDSDCFEHVWTLTEVGQRGARLDRTSECVRCGAVRYEAAPDPKKRPKL